MTVPATGEEVRVLPVADRGVDGGLDGGLDGGVDGLSAPELMGRARELAGLRRALGRTPAVVLVEGEAGIGKTRLVQEFLGSGPPVTPLVASCPPLREPFTLGPVVDALRHAAGDVRRLRLTALAGALRPFFPEWGEHLPPSPEPIEDSAAARHRLFRALAELLSVLAIDLLVVEDAHWADDTTVELLLFLLARQEPGPSLLITYRPEDVPAGSVLFRLTSRLPAGTSRHRLTLGGLDVGETAGLVSSMLQGEQVSAEFAEFLHRRTEGVPLAVEETVRLMHDRADLTRRSGEWVRRRLDAIDVPPTVRDAVLERAARLGEDAQAVLRAAAVLTDPAAQATLAEVSGLPPDRAVAGVDEAVGAGLLREHDRRQLGFRHVLASWAVYESIAGPGRAVLHRRAGEALERLAGVPVVRLARHFREAGDTDRWCRYAEQAADIALASGAAAEATTLLHEVIVSAQPPAETMVRLANKVPYASPQRYREIVAALRSTLSGDLGTAARAEVRFQLGHALTKMQEYDAGRVELERAIPDLGHDPYRAVRAMVLLGWPLDDTQPASAHLAWLHRAAEALPPAGTPERLRLDMDRASALLLLGEGSGWPVAATLPDVGDTHQVRRYISSGHVNLSHLATVWGHYGEARRRIDTATELARTNELGVLAGLIAVNRAHLDLFTGAWSGLAERAGELAADEDLPPMTRLEAELVRELLRMATELPGPGGDRSEERLTAVAEGAVRYGAIPESVEPAAALARLMLATGRTAEALAVTDRPMAVLARKQTWVWATEIAPVRTEALLAAGRADEAAALVAAYAEGLRGRDAPAPQAALLLCRAIVEDSASRFGSAADAYAALPRPYDALLARERQAGDDAGVLEQVYAGLAGIGARPAATRVAERLRRLGVDVRPQWRGGSRGYGDDLSPRELDVVRLLVGGRTNREIAELLYLSPKTVARHLNSAMRKLEVTSRTALAVRVVEDDLVAPD